MDCGRVAADARHGGRLPPPPGTFSTAHDIYFPIAQRPEPAFTLLARTLGAPDANAIRDAIHEVDPAIPVFLTATMEENLAQEEAPLRFATLLMTVFAGAALLLAALGVYGVLAFTVSQRTRELGLRAALGAQRTDTMRQVIASGGRMAVPGLAIGPVLALGLDRVLTPFLNDVITLGPTALAAPVTTLVAVATLACLVPALRATRIEPVVALKD